MRSKEGAQTLELVKIFEIKAARNCRTIFKWRIFMRLRVLCCLAILGVILLGTASFGQEKEKVPAPSAPEAKAPAPKAQPAKAQDIDPKQVVHQMCDYLKNLQQFSFQAEITEDMLLTSGQRIQYARSVEASVRRPDRFRAESVGDTDNRLLVYDGKTITLMDRSKNFYTTIAAPPTIDAALEHGIQAFNLRAPLADLIYTKAYEYLTEGVLSGFYVGLSKVQGVPCHHLAFREKDIDWQIWVEDSQTPVPRKFLITDKTARGLQFTAVFTKWNTSAQLEDGLFTFVAPEKAEKIDILPAAAPASPKKRQKR
jgi:hypothetical protein